MMKLLLLILSSMCTTFVTAGFMSSTPTSRFFAAAKAGDVAALKKEVAAGIDVNVPEEDGMVMASYNYTALHYAVSENRLEAVDYLLSVPDIDVNKKAMYYEKDVKSYGDPLGRTALCLALSKPISSFGAPGTPINAILDGNNALLLKSLIAVPGAEDCFGGLNFALPENKEVLFEILGKHIRASAYNFFMKTYSLDKDTPEWAMTFTRYTSLDEPTLIWLHSVIKGWKAKEFYFVPHLKPSAYHILMQMKRCQHGKKSEILAITPEKFEEFTQCLQCVSFCTGGTMVDIPGVYGVRDNAGLSVWSATIKHLKILIFGSKAEL